jgi:hypothetical protein
MGLLSRAESVVAEKRMRKHQTILMSAEVTTNATGNKLSQYAEKMEERGQQVYVLELTLETLLDQLTMQSDDPVQEEEIAQQWIDLLHELLGHDSFVLSIDKNQYVIIHSVADSMQKNFVISGIVRLASDVFGVDASDTWFEPQFYKMDAGALERFSVWIH